MIYLFLLKYIPQQVILTCQRQTDCLVGNYCNLNKLCYSCSYITQTSCDSMNGCCSQDFLFQCEDSSYLCITPNNEPINTNHLHSFLIVFCVVSLTYVSAGSCWNKYVKDKKGSDIFPNKRSWISLFRLVEDGINFTFSRIQRCYRNRLHGNRYNSIK